MQSGFLNINSEIDQIYNRIDKQELSNILIDKRLDEHQSNIREYVQDRFNIELSVSLAQDYQILNRLRQDGYVLYPSTHNNNNSTLSSSISQLDRTISVESTSTIIAKTDPDEFIGEQKVNKKELFSYIHSKGGSEKITSDNLVQNYMKEKFEIKDEIEILRVNNIKQMYYNTVVKKSRTRMKSLEDINSNEFIIIKYRYI